MDVAGIVDFGLQELQDRQLREFFLRAIEQASDDAARRRFVVALFTVDPKFFANWA